MKYRKKPVVIEAVKFNGASSHAAQIKVWMEGGEIPSDKGLHTRDIVNMEIKTPGS